MSDNYILYDPAAFGASEIKEDTRDTEITRLREENARLRSILSEVLSVWGVYYWPADVYRRAKAAIREGKVE